MSSVKRNQRNEDLKEVLQVTEVSTGPDGGWGWVVCCACFFCHVLTDGVMYSFGVIYVELLDYYKGSKGETAIVSSLSTGVCFLFGPVVAMLTNRYGCRVVVVIGSVVMSGGFILSIFAPNIQFLYFTLGILTGIGYGMIYLPSIVCVSQYFTKWRALATGIGVSGAGIGTFAFSPLTSLFVQAYAWQGAILIQAGLILNCLAFGLVYVPISATTSSTDRKLVAKICDKDVLAHCETNSFIDGNRKEKPFQNGEIVAKTNDYSLNQAPHNAQEPLLGEIAESRKTDGSSRDLKSRNTNVFQDLLKDCIRSLQTSFDISIFRNVAFCMFLVSTFFYSLGYYIPYIYLPVTAMEAGIDEFRASFLLSAVGITNTVGRVIFGFLSDRKCVNRMVLYATALVICGAATCVGPLLTSFGTFLVYSIVFGTFSGVTISLTSVILSDIVGIHRIADAFGVSNFFAGIASFAGPPLAGLLYDVSKSYLISYIAAGSAIFLSGAMLYCAPCIDRKSKEPEPETEVTVINT